MSASMSETFSQGLTGTSSSSRSGRIARWYYAIFAHIPRLHPGRPPPRLRPMVEPRPALAVNVCRPENASLTVRPDPFSSAVVF
jgi:hypothetical protein